STAAACLVGDSAASAEMMPELINLQANLASARDWPSAQIAVAGDERDARVKQMLAIIKHERQSHAGQIRNLQESYEAERHNVQMRIIDFHRNVNAERNAFGQRIEE